MLEYAYYFYDFFDNVLVYIYNFILENKVIFDVVFVGIASTVVLLIIDFIFDIRDEFGYFYKFRDEHIMRYKYRYGRHKKDNKDRLDLYDLHYRQNVDYNHKKKMDQLHYYRESENIRHEHKHEEFEMFNKNNIRQEKAKKPKPNLDIEYEEEK